MAESARQPPPLYLSRRVSLPMMAFISLKSRATSPSRRRKESMLAGTMSHRVIMPPIPGASPSDGVDARHHGLRPLIFAVLFQGDCHITLLGLSRYCDGRFGARFTTRHERRGLRSRGARLWSPIADELCHFSRARPPIECPRQPPPSLSSISSACHATILKRAKKDAALAFYLPPPPRRRLSKH